jgi:hypothetical protein
MNFLSFGHICQPDRGCDTFCGTIIMKTILGRSEGRIGGSFAVAPDLALLPYRPVDSEPVDPHLCDAFNERRNSNHLLFTSLPSLALS